MIWVGVDPGRSGAISFVPDLPAARPWCLSLSGSLQELSEGVRQAQTLGPLSAALEAVHSSPQMGVKSAFTFGQSYGHCEALLAILEIPFVRVSPQKWQRDMDCLTGGDKNVTKSLAAGLFPSLKVTHRNADSLILALWAKGFGPAK